MRAQRALAVTRFGPPAHLSGGDRPFALPVLRESNGFTRGLAHVVDAFTGADTTPHDGPLRVVYLDHVARLSGGELALGRLIAAMPDVEAHVILAEEGPLRELLERSGASVEVLPLDAQARDVSRTEVPGHASALRGALFTATYAARVARRLRELKPDLVHANSLKSGYYGSVAGRLAGIPVIWHVRDRIADDYMPGAAVRLTRAAIRTLPTAVLCNSEATLATIGSSLRGSVIASPVVYDPYHRGPTDASPRDATLAVGMVGRLAAWKGQDIFLRAFAAAELGDGVVARIIGSAIFGSEDQAYGDSLVALAADLGIASRVEFRGFVHDIESELTDLDVVVHASVVPEPFGQVVVEGMAAGLSVIATAAGGPTEIITDGIDGFLVPPRDVEALAKAIRTVVADSSLRARLRVAAKARATEFAPEAIGPKVEALYREVLGR